MNDTYEKPEIFKPFIKPNLKRFNIHQLASLKISSFIDKQFKIRAVNSPYLAVTCNFDNIENFKKF